MLSSHLLTEVEQLCSRICVLNQGRLVFDGAVSAAKDSQNWVRLRVSDFGAALKELRRAGWVTEEQGGWKSPWLRMPAPIRWFRPLSIQRFNSLTL